MKTDHPALQGMNQPERAEKADMVVLKFPYPVSNSVAKDLLANVNYFYGGDAVMVTGYVAYSDGFGRIVQKEEISA